MLKVMSKLAFLLFCVFPVGMIAADPAGGAGDEPDSVSLDRREASNSIEEKPGVNTGGTVNTGGSGADGGASDIRSDTEGGSSGPVGGEQTFPRSGGGITSEPSASYDSFGVGGRSGGGIFDAGGLPFPDTVLEPAAHWPLFAVLSLLAFSLILLKQSFEFLRWVTRGEDLAPNPASGIPEGLAVCFFIIVLWYLRWCFTRAFLFVDDYPPDPATAWLVHIVCDPKDFSVGVLLGSLVPAALAFMKFAMATQFGRNIETDGLIRRSAFGAFVGLLFSLVQLIASVATLVWFVREF